MKHSERVAARRKAAAGMQLIATMDGDWEMLDEMVAFLLARHLRMVAQRKRQSSSELSSALALQRARDRRSSFP
jgi:hypothetical protein